MSEPVFFQMPEMSDADLRSLFTLLVPTYLNAACISCGFQNEKPIAIIATADTQLSNILKENYSGITELKASEIPDIKYHTTGNKTLWTV